MDHAIAESALVQQLKLQPDIVRQGWIASSHNDGGEEQMTLVDPPELQCPSRAAAVLSCLIASGSNSR
jgi:hypothetical protein